MSKSILGSLKITSKPAAQSGDPIVDRRNRLLERLTEQRALALCFVDGKPFVGPDKLKKVIDETTGEATTTTVQKRVKAWFSGSSDNMILEIRYGNVPIEFAPGKAAIEIGKVSKLVPTIDTVIEAAKAGEFDELLTANKKPAKAKAAAAK